MIKKINKEGAEMRKIDEAKLVLKKAGYKVTEGSFSPDRFEYSRGRQGDNNPNDSKPTGVKYSRTGNIHEGEGARAFLEARRTLAKAGYKIYRESDEEINPEEQEPIVESRANKIRTIVEAKKLLAKSGYKVVREEYDQDIDHPSNISIPGKSEDQKPALKNNGNAPITSGGDPQESHEKGDTGIPGSFREAVQVLKKAGIKITKNKKIKEMIEFGSGDYDDEGGFGDSEPPLGMGGDIKDEPFVGSSHDVLEVGDEAATYDDLDFVDSLTSDPANFHPDGSLRTL
jgi:hypothetical protein